MAKKGLNIYVKASVFYVLGNGIGQGMVFLSSILFTRIMSQSDFGLYSTYYSIVTILTTLVGANLFNGLNNAYVDFKDDVLRYRASNLILSTLVFAGISVLTAAANGVIGGRVSFYLVIMALLHSYGLFVVTYYTYSCNMENKYKQKAVLLMLPNVLQIALSAVFILTLPINSMYARVTGSTLGVVSCAMAVYVIMLNGQRNVIEKKYWVYGLKISVPSVLSSISYMIMSHCDAIMITAFRNAEETAVYSLIYNIGYIMYAMMQATNGALQAWLFRKLDKKDVSGVCQVQKWYLYIYVIIAIGLLMVSPEVIQIIAPSSYWKFMYVAPFVLGSLLMIMYSFYTTLGLFYKRTGRISVYVCIAAVVNIVLNAIFIPKLGGVAASVTSATAYFLLFILLRSFGQRLYKDFYSSKYFVVSFAVVFMSCLLFEFIYSHIIIRYIIYLCVLVCMSVYAIIRRDEWMKLLNFKR